MENKSVFICLIRVIGVPVFNHKEHKVLHEETQRINQWVSDQKITTKHIKKMRENRSLSYGT